MYCFGSVLFQNGLKSGGRVEGDKFTPLESHSIYAGDGINRKHQLLIEGGVKAPSFLTGFTST
jgi:hypothetical protein